MLKKANWLRAKVSFSIFEPMKVLKNILIVMLLVLTVFSYLGHDIVDYYSHVTDKIENSLNSKASPRSITHESSFEDDSHIISLRNIIKIDNYGGRSFVSLLCFIPPKLYYSIWLPPELS
jgi:hypothetical protein